jgi:hypothetical protein
MRRKNKRKICISIALSFILLISFFIVFEASSARGSGVPLKLALTAESSNIGVGETTIITLTLEDENNEPITTEVDVIVNISTNIGSAPSSLLIASGTRSTSAKFLSQEPGIAVISAKSKGLISDSISIAITSSKPTPQSTPATPTPPPVMSPREPGFGAVFAIAGALAAALLMLEGRRDKR